MGAHARLPHVEKGTSRDDGHRHRHEQLPGGQLFGEQLNRDAASDAWRAALAHSWWRG
ncbi:hypothetical protein Dimus_033877, partial [Dionaea muscipula]